MQLRISENGEMSVTGIQGLDELLDQQVECKTESKPKREPPALKLIAKNTIAAVSCSTAATVESKSSAVTSVVNMTTKTTVALEKPLENSRCKSSTSCTTIFPVHTVNSVSNNATTITVTATKTVPTSKPQISTESSQIAPVNHERSPKHKLEDANHGEPPSKQIKQTILNHSLGLQHLSNNHPLKKHSQVARPQESEAKANADVKVVKPPVFTKPAAVVNKSFANVQPSRPGTPITTQKWPLGKPQNTTPCYMPKTTFSPVINVPKVAPKVHVLQNTVITTPTTSVGNKMTIKTKPTTPIGYKTLRDPPKTWNPQISRANLVTKTSDPKCSDLKSVRPPKFFKIRNNMPRYLGNPASGVKPMYQVHTSPEKDKSAETGSKSEKSEIKKHSIVKIDPKTLKPITEKAPESSSLSSQSDLKINTSSVPIFQPLKLQGSPKNERKSPKSPHSPKPKTTSSSSPPGKREKMNLSFTPPNPFIPNLTSPTVSPSQFLYPSGPPGFPSYDPRFMVAYHNLLYGQRMPFTPNPLQGLSRKPFELPSPKMTSQLSPKMASQLSPKNSGPSSPKMPGISPSSKGIVKKTSKEGYNKPEKSLQNAVEKLTQNRAKESKKNEESAKTDGSKATVVKEVRQSDEHSDKLLLQKNAVGNDVPSGDKDKAKELKMVNTGTKLNDKNSNNNSDSVTSLVTTVGDRKE